MFKDLCIFLVFSTSAGLVKCAGRNLPPYIEPCRESDPEINKCFIENGNKAIPELGNGDKALKIPTVNPLIINELILEPGGNLKLAMKNIEIYGLNKIKIIDADCRLKDNVVYMKLDLPLFQILGDYEMNGRLLILPIVGKGKVNITAVTLDVNYTLKFNKEKKNDIEVIKVEDNDVQYKPKRIYYDFQNLLNQDERLANEMKKFLNESWEEINNEFYGSFREVIGSIIKTLITQVVREVPYHKIFLP